MDFSRETTLLVIRECFVYRIPPRTGAKGHRAADWDVNGYLWTGRLRVVAVGETAYIKLEDQNSGELFAVSKYDPESNSVESVTDSSRYFVLRIENERGQHTFIGLGFQERTYAFDFNVALQDHIKHITNEKEAEKRRLEWESQPKKDYSLKDGENIHIKIPGAATTAKPKVESTPAQANPAAGFSFLPPPPSGKRANSQSSPPPQQRSPQQQISPQPQRSPQPQQNPQQSPQQTGQLVDWGDFNDFSSSSSNSSGNSWTRF